MKQNSNILQKSNINVPAVQNQELENDLNQLFQQLRVDNQKPNITDDDTIDQTTLMALLLYLGLDSVDPEFFNYITKILENQTKITRAQFRQILLEPEIQFKNLKNEEMTSIFKIFDRNQNGSFSADDFIYFYKQTQDFQQLSKDEQQLIFTRIKKDFEVINPDGNEITPIEFFKIINHSNQG